MDYPKQVKEALAQAGVTINSREQQQIEKDARFVYGANCTWFGSIHEVGTTAPGEDGLPCCPLCRGMLFEMEDGARWWEGVDSFEKGIGFGARPHPGYRAMLEWQGAQKKCFSMRDGGLTKLAEAYKAATGIFVDIDK